MGEKGFSNEVISIYENDPLAKFLIEKARLTPVKLGLYFIILQIILNILPAWYFGVLFANNKNVIGLFEVWNFPVFEFIVAPIVWGYYLWMSKSPLRMFNGIKSARLIDISDVKFDKMLKERVIPAYNHKGWVIASILVVFSTAIISRATEFEGNLWKTINPIYKFIKHATEYLGWYAVCMIVAKELVTIGKLRQLFKNFKVKLYPLHPDKCGGLLPLNEYAMTFTYFIALAGFGESLVGYSAIQAGTFFEQFHVPFFILAYIVLAVYTFFAPLGAAHNAMKDTKKKWLLKISEQFQTDYESVQKALKVPTVNLKENVEKIEQLQKVYKLTEDFPVWPFNMKTIARFMATIFTSLTPLLLSLLAEFIRKLIG